jgi:hypothetical protein
VGRSEKIHFGHLVLGRLAPLLAGETHFSGASRNPEANIDKLLAARFRSDFGAANGRGFSKYLTVWPDAGKFLSDRGSQMIGFPISRGADPG